MEQQMAGKDVAAAGEVTTTDMKTLIGAIKDLAESNQKDKEISYAEIAERDAPKVKLKCGRFFLNGVMVLPHEITDDDRTLINQIKPGRYNHRKWEVIKRSDSSLDIRVPMRTVDQRFTFKNETKGEGFVGMLKAIVLESEAKVARRKSGQFDEDDDN
jgi:hypothetical protein